MENNITRLQSLLEGTDYNHIFAVGIILQDIDDDYSQSEYKLNAIRSEISSHNYIVHVNKNFSGDKSLIIQNIPFKLLQNIASKYEVTSFIYGKRFHCKRVHGPSVSI